MFRIGIDRRIMRLMDSATILIVDDHPLFADGFQQMVGQLRPGWKTEVARSAAEAFDRFDAAATNLVVVDAGLPDEDGLVVVRRLRAIAPDVPHIVISGRNDAAIRTRARAGGAKGFITKALEPAAIVDIMTDVLTGGSWFDDGTRPALPDLTPRQSEVLELLAAGHGNKEIRYRLGIAERTVRAHLTELFQLLGVGSRMQAVIRAREMGLVE